MPPNTADPAEAKLLRDALALLGWSPRKASYELQIHQRTVEQVPLR